MTMLVLGATGLLGQAVAAEAVRRGIAVQTAARSGADFDLDVADSLALDAVTRSARPKIVVNCAALVDVRACDDDPGRAYRINAAPLATLARWSAASGAKLVHISTDHFFAGDGPVAHDEEAAVELFNQYAATKFAGEHFALLAPTALVLRTSIVGVRRWEKPSFAEWVIDAVERDSEMVMFADAYTSSIDVGAFAHALFDLIDRGTNGLLNLASSQVYSKAQFIRRIAGELGRNLTRASLGSVHNLSPPRPGSLGLDVAKAQRILGRELPDLNAVVRAVLATYRGE